MTSSFYLSFYLSTYLFFLSVRLSFHLAISLFSICLSVSCLNDSVASIVHASCYHAAPPPNPPAYVFNLNLSIAPSIYRTRDPLFLSLFLSICPSLCFFCLSLSVCPSLSKAVSLYLWCFCFPTFLPTYLSIYLPTSLSIFLRSYLCISLTSYPSIIVPLTRQGGGVAPSLLRPPPNPPPALFFTFTFKAIRP